MRGDRLRGAQLKLAGDRLGDPNQVFDTPETLAGKVLQVGKKKFVRLVP
jgi:tyrosyl-tRNA synthetase